MGHGNVVNVNYDDFDKMNRKWKRTRKHFVTNLRWKYSTLYFSKVKGKEADHHVTKQRKRSHS